jgi:hypothetical protein
MLNREREEPPARGPGRPATGATVKKVSITLPKGLWEEAEKFAFSNGRPLSRVISDALAKDLGKEGAK